MRVTGTDHIEAVIRAQPGSKKARDLRAWLTFVRSATWFGPADLKKSFPGAISMNGRLWTFPLLAAGGAVEAIVGFRGQGQVVIKRVI